MKYKYIFLPLVLLWANISHAQWSVDNYRGYGLPGGTIWGIISAFMLWVLSLVAVFAVIAFVVSGIQYMISAGNEKTIETAKRNTIYSIVGVVVSLLGLIILRAVDGWLSGNGDF